MGAPGKRDAGTFGPVISFILPLHLGQCPGGPVELPSPSTSGSCFHFPGWTKVFHHLGHDPFLMHTLTSELCIWSLGVLFSTWKKDQGKWSWWFPTSLLVL